MCGRRLLSPIVLLAAVFGLSLPAAASNHWLRGPALKNLVTGKHIYLQVPFGGEFPLYYKPDGTVSGDGSGAGLGRFFAPKETGRWWVKGPNLCQKWPTWYHGKTTCFKIEKTGSRSITWLRNDGKSGKARIGN